MELLAPVGSKEALVAAVEAGCDAVYLAGKMFGARAYAANFTDEELAEAINFAHLRNVKVNVAVNTIIDNNEIEDLAVYLTHLYNIGADAIIVQDFGVVNLAKKVVPELPLHASTQMAVHNLEGVKFLESLGFKRIVLARELSLAEIKEITANTSVEIETFVHGALCISYSGQCLMSGMIGGRSGNRGRCAQPCRLPYTLVDEENNNVLNNIDVGEYLLSPKDLKTIEVIPELINAGVHSFKIEGRMKRAEYVAVVVDAYRRAIDQYLLNAEVNIGLTEDKNLAQIFNRDFTQAYLFKKLGRKMMSDKRPNNRGVKIGRILNYDYNKQEVMIKLDEELRLNDIIEIWVKVGGRVSATITNMKILGKNVDFAPAGQVVTLPLPNKVRNNDRVFKVFDAQLIEKARSFFVKQIPLRRVGVTIDVEAAIGKPLQIIATDVDGYVGEAYSNFIGEKAHNRPLSEEVILKQIERLGATIFNLEKLNCTINGEVMIPISEINETRRKAIEVLEQQRLIKFKRNEINTCLLPKLLKNGTNTIKPRLTVNLDDANKVTAAINSGADAIIFGGESFNHQQISIEQYQRAWEIVRKNNKQIIFSLPRLLKLEHKRFFYENFMELKKLNPDGWNVSNLWSLELLNKEKMPIYLDYTMNIYNNYAINFFGQYNIKGLTLSPELNFAQVEKIASFSTLPLECLVQGNLELMLSEHCVIGSHLGNLDSGKCTQPCLKKQYFLLDRKEALFPLITDQYCRMHVLNGKELSMLSHVERFKENNIASLRIEAKYGDFNKTTQLISLYRKLIDGKIVDEAIINKYEEDITRGHYFRGVL